TSNYQTTKLIDLQNGYAESGLAQGSSAFPALAPDGSRFFTSSGGIINGDSTSQLYTLPAGTLVSAPTGLPANLRAALPTFAPDSSSLVFNFFAGPAGADGKSLAVMPFTAATNAFGAIDKIYTPGTGETAVWPSFFPTSKGVVFEIETNTNEWGFTR